MRMACEREEVEFRSVAAVLRELDARLVVHQVEGISTGAKRDVGTLSRIVRLKSLDRCRLALGHLQHDNLIAMPRRADLELFGGLRLCFRSWH